MVESIRMMKSSSQRIQKLKKEEFSPRIKLLGNHKFYIMIKGQKRERGMAREQTTERQREQQHNVIQAEGGKIQIC